MPEKNGKNYFEISPDSLHPLADGGSGLLSCTISMHEYTHECSLPVHHIERSEKPNGNGMKRPRFLEIREKVLEKIALASARDMRAQEVGHEREVCVDRILAIFKEAKMIRDFVPTGLLSHADLVRGIDCFVTIVASTRYAVLKISITGPFWKIRHEEKHPGIPVVTVDLDKTPNDRDVEIGRQLLKIIESHQETSAERKHKKKKRKKS